ncbi:MAG: glycosyltransferase family 2 protein [Candidatus Omnitrophica bacterium]|nr:glycosyltransferase family 2 protein [Candidatus Omnitrophota bacterium]
MEFNFSRHGLKGIEKKVQRLFEIIPGATSWAIIIGMIILSFWEEELAAVIIIAFYLYWLMRIFYLTIFLILSYNRLSIEKGVDWITRARGLGNFDDYLKGLQALVPGIKLKDRLSRLFHRKELESFKKRNIEIPALDDIYQLVIIPIANEVRSVVEPGIRSIAASTFPSRKILIVLALEERSPETVKEGVYGIQAEFKNSFFDILVSVHPNGIPGEARVKGANASHAAREAAEFLKSKGIAFKNVIVSCFDSDTVVKPVYFACLTYNFMVCPDRYRASFQPIPVYYNNIWDVPAFARVIEAGSSFFQLIEATNPEKLVTFSSHSMSFAALVEVGYWPVDMVSDDSAIFWKAYIHYDGNYKVVPIYTTVSMDIVAADSWRKTVINEYKQKRRWAWGVENFPIVMRGFLKNNKIPFYNKIRLGFKLFEGHISWATWAFLLTFIGGLPALFAGKAFQHSVLYYSAPRVAGIIFNLASFSLVTSIILSILLLPPQKVRYRILHRIIFALQWLFVPVIFLFLGAIPALDAQTRLMMGKRMEFWVAAKKRENTK